MKKSSLFASAALAALTLAAAIPAMAQGPFSDVPTDHWAYSAVDKLKNAGIVEGYPDKTYGGPRPMTRYEFAVAIARLTSSTSTCGMSTSTRWSTTSAAAPRLTASAAN